jgi:hypothetical protein
VSRVSSSLRAQATLAIGFTGHRSLPDEDKSRQLICGFLERRKTATRGMISGISSVAAGGDLLFTESCVQLEIAFRVLLPMPETEFRDDFDAATWPRAESVLRKATSFEVTGADQPRDELYYECGIATVHQSALLVALWDGEPSRGKGGTADIVAFARKIGRPVVWFHSSTGNVTIFNSEAEQKLMDELLERRSHIQDVGLPGK